MTDQTALYLKRKKEAQARGGPQPSALRPDENPADPSETELYAVRKADKTKKVAAATAMALGNESNPDQYAQDEKLATEYQTQVNPSVTPPVSVVSKNRDRMRGEVARVQNTQTLSKSPMLTRWLGNEANRRAAADDIPALSAVENALKRGIVHRGDQVYSQITSDMFMYSADQYGLTFAERYKKARGSNYGYIMGKPPEDGAFTPLEELADDPIEAFVKAGAGTLADWGNWALGRTQDEDLADAASWQQRAGQAAKNAQALPMSAPAKRAMAKLQSDEPLSLGEAARRTLDLAVNDPQAMLAMIGEVGIESAGSMIPAAVATLATRNPAVGAATMGATSYNIEQNLAPVEFFAKRGYDLSNEADVERMLGNRELMAEAAEQGHIRGLIIGALDFVSGGVAGKALAKNPVADAAVQSLVQGALGGSGEGLAQFATEGEVDYGEVIVEALAEFSTAPIDVAAIGARRLGQKKNAANEVAQTTETIQTMSEAATSSKLRERSPEKFRDFVASTVAGTDVETMYIPADAFVGYFQSQGMEVEAAAELLPGVTAEQIKRAQVTGEDIIVPTTTYMEKIAGSDMDAFVMENAKFTPQAMTAEEAKAFEEDAQLEEARVAAQQDVAEQIAATEDEAATQVYNEVVEQLVETGRPRAAANAEAQLYPAFYTTLAKRLKTSTAALIDTYKPPVVNGASPLVEPKKKSVDNLTRDLAGMRARMNNKTAQPTPVVTAEMRAALGAQVAAEGEQLGMNATNDERRANAKRREDAFLTLKNMLPAAPTTEEIKGYMGAGVGIGTPASEYADPEAYAKAKALSALPGEIGNMMQDGATVDEAAAHIEEVLGKPKSDSDVYLDTVEENIRAAGLDPATATDEEIRDALTGDTYSQTDAANELDDTNAPLYVVHNISANGLREANKMGALVSPSIAVARGDIGFSNFGEISLVGEPGLIDPKKKGMRAFNADIYSARQPHARFKVREKDARRIKKATQEAEKVLGFEGRLDVSEIERGGLSALEADATVKAAWLLSNGEDIPVMRRPPPPKPVANPIFEDFKAQEEHDLMADPAFPEAVRKQREKVIKDYTNKTGGKGEELREALLDADGKPHAADVRKFARQVSEVNRAIARYKPDAQGDISSALTEKALYEALRGREDEYNTWVANEFGEDIGARFFEDVNGRKREYTVQNVVREMNRTLRNGEFWNYGAGNIRAAVAPEFSTVTDIKKARGSIVSSDMLEEVKKEVDDKLFALADKFAPYHNNSKDFGWSDIFSEFLKGLALGPRKLTEWQNHVFSTPAPDALVQEARDFLSMLQGLPTEYFEVKAQRPVEFSEFHAAIVPKGLSSSAVKILTDSGLRIVEYERGNPGARQKALQEVGDKVFFQSTEAQEERGRISIPKDGVASGQAVIDLFKNADLSTFLHESSHFFLSVLQDMAAQPGANAEVAGMYGQAKAWWKSNVKSVAREASKVTPREGLAQGSNLPDTMRIDDLLRSEDGAATAAAAGGGSKTQAPVKVTQLPDGRVYLVNGYHRVFDAQARGDGDIPVSFVPFDQVRVLYENEKTFVADAPAIDFGQGGGTYSQSGQAQTDTEEFKAWAGNSLITEDGELPSLGGKAKVFYHGTRAVDISEFDTKNAAFFGDEATASLYAKNNTPLYPVYLKTDRTLYIEAEGRNYNDLKEAAQDVVGEAIDELGIEEVEKIVDFRRIETDDVVALAKELGYDAVVFDDIIDPPLGKLTQGKPAQVVAILKPENIKSATDNSGAFDPNDPNIYKQGGTSNGKSKVTEADVVAYLDNGTTGDAAKDHAVDVAMQEQWARAFEKYLMEGKAPTDALRSAFEQFRAWLLEVYRKVKGNLGVEVTDDIRQVFDMLLATDEEISRAQVDNIDDMLAASAQELGVSEEEYATLAALHQEGRDKAAADTIREAMKPIRRMRDDKFKERRAAIRDEVEAEVNARPVYRAIEWMGNKRWLGAKEQPKVPNGMRMSKEQLVERYGPRILRALPRGSFRVYTPGGMDIDEAAGWFGFSSGDEMKQAMVDAPKRENVIAHETDARAMAELSKDEGIAEAAAAATEAFHTNKRGDYIAAELRTLYKSVGSENKARYSTASYARQVAKRALASMRARDAVASNRYLSAERRAAEQAQAAFAKKDIAAAADFKRKQLVNHMMFVESRRIADEVGKTERLAKRLQSKGTRKSLANDYLGAIDDVLEQYDFRKHGPGKENNRARMLAYVEGMKAQGRENEIAIPQHILDNAKAEPYMTLPVERLRGVYQTLKNIESTARRTQKLIDAKRERDMDEVVNDMADAFADNVKARPPGLVDSKGEKFRRGARQFFDLVLNADTLLREIDGYTDGGSAYQHLKRGIDDATAQLQVRRQEAAEKLDELYSVYTPKERNLMAVPQHVKEIGASVSKWDMIAVVLNMGNEDGIQRLTDPKVEGSFNRAQLDAIVERMEKRDMDFVQSVWDFVGSFYPEIAAREKRVTGVAPERVDAAQLVTSKGTYAGGYYPLKYDGRRSGKVAEETAADIMGNMMVGRFGKAQTRNGHTKERAASSGRPVLLDIGVLHGHINSVLHDLMLSEQVTNTWRILQDPRVKDMFYSAGKQTDYQSLEMWVQDVASGQVNGDHTVLRAVRGLKSGFTVSKLAFNLSTVAVQVTGLAQSMVVIGKRNFAHGLIEYAKDPVAKSKHITEVSNFMAERETTFNKDIYDMIGDVKLGPKAGAYKRFMQERMVPMSFWLMQKVQFYTVDVPTWLGAHRKAITEGATAEDAIASADRMVARAQASGIFSDRSPIERGTVTPNMRQNEFVRLFTTLGSYMFAKANVAYERTGQTDFSSPQEVFSYAADMVLLFTLEAILYNLIKGTLPGMGDDDDDESWAAFLAKETAFSVMSTVPFVRDITSPLQGFSGGGSYGSITETLADPVIQALQGDVDKAFVRSVVNTSGMLLHLPSAQANRFIDAGWRQSEGDDVAPMEYIMGKR